MVTFEVKIGNEIKKLDGIVSFDDGYHIISNKLFDILVWGNTKKDTEVAFDFTFQAIYQNFALEDKNNLSLLAQRLKQSLLSHS